MQVRAQEYQQLDGRSVQERKGPPALLLLLLRLPLSLHSRPRQAQVPLERVCRPKASRLLFGDMWVENHQVDVEVVRAGHRWVPFHHRVLNQLGAYSPAPPLHRARTLLERCWRLCCQGSRYFDVLAQVHLGGKGWLHVILEPARFAVALDQQLVRLWCAPLPPLP